VTQLTQRIILFVFGVVFLLYLVQAFTPLRLDTDGITYLSLGDYAATNGLAAAIHQPDFPFPKGYAVFLSFLMKLHLFSSATLVLSNLLFLCLALTFTFFTLERLGFSRLHSEMACLLTLLSFCTVKHVTQGRSDFLFFALSACSCWLMSLPGKRKWLAVVPCLLCAIEVRFIGLALLAPIATELWESVRRRQTLLVFTLSGLGACSLVGILAGHQYLQNLLGIFDRVGLRWLAKRDVLAHAGDFAELAGNVPFSKLPASLHAIFIVFGIFFTGLLLFGIRSVWQRSRWLCCYLIACSCLILPWPFNDPRFWLPVTPLLFLTAHSGWETLFAKFQTRIVAAYVGIFCVLGLLALGYSTRLTFSGSEFAYRYGDGRLRKTYMAGCSASDTDPEKQNAARLLQRYQWHCENRNNLAVVLPNH
jgi:hypothetical protein